MKLDTKTTIKELTHVASKNLKYYVYALICSKTDEYAYVGKGNKNRIYSHRNDMNKTNSRKNSWLKSNEFYEFIFSSHGTSKSAFEAEAMMMSFLGKHPTLVIDGGLLNATKGHHEIMMPAERYEKLYGADGEFDTEKMRTLFEKEDRAGAILNILHTANELNDTKTTYREMATGYKRANKARLHSTTEIFIRYKGIIVEHWKDVKWLMDPYKGSVWFGTKIESEYVKTNIIGATRHSQASVCYLGMPWSYQGNRPKQKQKISAQ